MDKAEIDKWEAEFNATWKWFLDLPIGTWLKSKDGKIYGKCLDRHSRLDVVRLKDLSEGHASEIWTEGDPLPEIVTPTFN